MYRVLELHCLVHLSHDMWIGRRVALRDTEKLASLVRDNDYEGQPLWKLLRSNSVRQSLRLHTLVYDYAHDAQWDSELYDEHWMAETPFSVIRRWFGSSVYPARGSTFR